MTATELEQTVTYADVWPAGVEIGEQELVIERELTFAEWRSIGENLRRVEESLCWAFGDWWLYGERFAGEHGEALRSIIDRSDSSLKSYAWVARRFPPERRRKWLNGGLLYKHFLAVASMDDTGEQDRWLDEAAAQGWSGIELHDRIAQRQLTGPRPPSLTVRAVGELVERWNARATALGVPPRDLVLTVLELASGLDDPVAVLEAARLARTEPSVSASALAPQPVDRSAL